MNPLTLFKIVAVSCLLASVASANIFARHLRNLQQAPSQLKPRSVAASAESAAKAAAQQAKLHYSEIEPSLKGAYGYVDTNDKQRIAKYTAGKAGFVVEGDQEAAGQQGTAAAAPAPSPQQAEPQRRPQLASLPQQAQPSQPTFRRAPIAAPRCFSLESRPALRTGRELSSVMSSSCTSTSSPREPPWPHSRGSTSSSIFSTNSNSIPAIWAIRPSK